MAKVPLIAVVGICAVGKSMVVEALRQDGYSAMEIAQEHSELPYMWARSNPGFIIYLTASDEAVQQRRSYLTPQRLQNQRQRLAHVSRCADLVIDSTDMDADEMVTAAREALDSGGIARLPNSDGGSAADRPPKPTGEGM